MEDELVYGCDARLSGDFCGRGSVMVNSGLMIVSWLERRVFHGGFRGKEW